MNKGNAEGAPGGPNKAAAAARYELHLGEAAATSLPMTSQLTTLLESAAAYRNAGGDEENFPVSFRTVLMGIFYAGGAWSQWAISLAQNTGFDRPKLGALPTSAPPLPTPLRTTSSVASLLHTAREYAQRANTILDVPHLIAAIVFAPAGHEGELASYGFDKLAWANALVDESARRSPVNTEVFRALRDAAFPVTKAESPPPQSKLAAENAPAGDTPGALDRAASEQRDTYQVWDRPHVDNDHVAGEIPPDRDLLDVRKPALRFAKLLAARDVQPPIALGLFGNWGSGKTFFMGLMRDRIADLANKGGQGYVRRVVQIEFNAWHYHDTNLWASLAMRIFEGLAKELGGKKQGEVEKKRKELHQKISSSAARRDEAKEIRRLALERRSTAAQELEAQRALRDRKLREHASVQLAAAWRVVAQSKRFEKLRGVAHSLAGHFGIHAVLGSVEQVRQLKRDVEDTRTHALGIFTAIGRRFDGRSATVWTVFLLTLTLLAALSLGWGIEWLNSNGKLNLPQFSGTLVQVATLVSAVVAWCGRRVRELRGALDAIGAVEEEFAAAEKTVVPDDALRKLEAEISELDKDIHQKSEEVVAAEREIAEATAEIERINRGGLVYDFLQERSAAQTYLGQLGLVSTIRQDLERLAALLKDFGHHGNNPIERIVLYIDDLDRCHPDKVVEVLQAVHLLLAFDLFNVVVGVDARWLERSLLRQYVGDKDGAARPEDPFSSQDYLEKIFQIPYALSPIGEAGFKSLIGGMIETRTEWLAKKQARAAQQNAAADLRQVAEREQPQPEPQDEQTAVALEQADTEEREPLGDRTAAQHPAEEAAEVTLFFEDHEESFIQLMHAFVDRPRLAKRFINIYRLLRVRADDEGEGAIFAASEVSSEFRAALVLLAINVGHPAVAAKLTRAIESAPKTATLPILFEDLTKGTCKTVACSDRERQEIADVEAKLKAIGERVPMELDAYRRWAPRVGCFSFDWHRFARPSTVN